MYSHAEAILQRHIQNDLKTSSTFQIDVTLDYFQSFENYYLCNAEVNEINEKVTKEDMNLY